MFNLASRLFRLCINPLSSIQRFLIPKNANPDHLKNNFYIKPGYKSRNQYIHYDDLPEQDTWQLEVYLRAYGLMKKYGWKTVADIGCGSAYKLITYLGDFQTIGYELPINVHSLIDRYPDRDWRVSDFNSETTIKADLVICSDVVEHLENPDVLMNFLKRVECSALILSTPERDICRGKNDLGPPKNPAHQREWNFKEFNMYVSQFFDIEYHAVVNNEQGTQMMICKKRSSLKDLP